jgi:hypothetical protein
MRNALMMFLLAFVALGVVAARVASADTSISNYAAPLPDNGVDSASLLPLHGQDLPLTASDVGGSSSSAPQASVVEAIPTPTAFQAGAVLLAGLAVVRGVKKLRLA